MTIDEAIDCLTYWREDFIDLGREEGTEALKIGIEALKAIKSFRHFSNPYVKALLPGETEE